MDIHQKNKIIFEESFAMPKKSTIKFWNPPRSLIKEGSELAGCCCGAGSTGWRRAVRDMINGRSPGSSADACV